MDGEPYHQAVARRIIGPLGLKALRALAPRGSPADLAPAEPAMPESFVMVPGWACATGSIVGSAEDMLAFWHALLTGRLLSLHTVAQMFDRLYPMFDSGSYYGRGVMLYAVADAGHDLN